MQQWTGDTLSSKRLREDIANDLQSKRPHTDQSGSPYQSAGAPSHASTHPRQHMPTPATAGPRAGPSTGYQHTPSYQHAAANAAYSQHAAQRPAGGTPAQYSYMPGATHNAAAAAASAGGWRPHGTAAGWTGGAAGEEFGGHTGVVPVAMPPKLPKGVADSAMNQRVDFKSDDDSILPRGGIDKVLQRLGLSKDVQLSKEVELAVIELAENMLDHTMEFACLMASRRGGKWLEAKDAALYLERNWNLHLPGYGNRGVHPAPKFDMDSANAKQQSAVRDAIGQLKPVVPERILARQATLEGTSAPKPASQL